MATKTQITAKIDVDLKRRAFAQFALRDMKFSSWLIDRLNKWVSEMEMESDPSRATSEDVGTSKQSVS